jgi:hypothetical protein
VRLYFQGASSSEVTAIGNSEKITDISPPAAADPWVDWPDLHKPVQYSRPDGANEVQSVVTDGARWATHRSVRLLVEQGRIDEAIRDLRALADTGDRVAVYRLADLLIERGRVDEAIRDLRALVDAGDRAAALVLARYERVEEAWSGSGESLAGQPVPVPTGSVGVAPLSMNGHVSPTSGFDDASATSTGDSLVPSESSTTSAWPPSLPASRARSEAPSVPTASDPVQGDGPLYGGGSVRAVG